MRNTSFFNMKRLTKYEVTKTISERAEQISYGAECHVDVQGLSDPLEMATKEFYEGKNPLVIRRYFPNHTPEKPHFEDIPCGNN